MKTSNLNRRSMKSDKSVFLLQSNKYNHSEIKTDDDNILVVSNKKKSIK